MNGVIVFSNGITARHKYIIPYVLSEICGFEVKLTSEVADYSAFVGAKLNYTKSQILPGEIHIIPNGFLDLKVPLQCNAWIEKENQDLPLFIEAENVNNSRFDPFAASFFLLTRHEEYFSFEPDSFGRFDAASSLMYQHGVLEIPLVNKWAEQIAAGIRAAFPELKQQERKFSSTLSIDVDQAYAFRHRGLKRNLLALARNITLIKPKYLGSQVKTILFRRKDPFDSYGYLENIVRNTLLPLIIFINVGAYSRFDKNLDIRKKALRQLLQKLKTFATIGIHPSYYATEDPTKLHEEKLALENAIGETVIKSRQHYLKLLFPHTYRELIHAGIHEDYTMGFASHPGFRAGCCTPFNWFDLQRNAVTELRIYPFTYMDGALAEDLKLSPEEAMVKIDALTKTVKQYNGYLLSIWHNHTINDKFFWKGWKKVFEDSLKTMRG